MNPLTLISEEEQGGLLWHTGASWHQMLASHGPEGIVDRFEAHSGNINDLSAYPLGEEWEEAYAYWTDEGSSAALLLAIHRAEGHRALLLWDLAGGDDTPGSGDWCVVSTKRWYREPSVAAMREAADARMNEGLRGVLEGNSA